MEFMGFHIIDIVIVVLIAFLAIKGLVNGFTKELLNFIAVVGGVILAARYNSEVVTLINEQAVFPPISDSFAQPIGFIAIIIAVLIVVSIISSIATAVIKSTTGFLSRVAGYILSAVRYVFIFSLILFGVNQSDFFSKWVDQYQDKSQLFKPMSDIGMQALNYDINETVSEINEALESNVTSVDGKRETKEINITTSPAALVTDNNNSN